MAAEVGGLAVSVDVGVEADVVRLIGEARDAHGRIDLFCSNAGLLFGVAPAERQAPFGVEAPDEAWERLWRVNCMAHVYAARAILPVMLDQGGGYILATASAAGLLTTLGNAPYSVTKHGVLALAEWLAITYGDAGIRVSCLCPEGVRTHMLASAGDSFLEAGAIEPEDVAGAVVEGLATERFLILPHPRVAEYFLRKATDYDRWLAGMRQLQARLAPNASEAAPPVRRAP